MTTAPRQLVVIGDSSVYGWGDQEGGGWCERLRRQWMTIPSAPVVYGLGVRGDGLERIAQRWQQEWGCRGELRRQQPDGLLLSVGLNDSARVGRPDGRQQLGTDAFRFGLEQLLTSMTPVTQVMVMGLGVVDEAVMPFADCLWYSNQEVAVHEAQLEEACLEVDVPFLSLHRAMGMEPDWLTWLEPDGIHLNSRGHQWIHQRLQDWKPILNWAGFEQDHQLTPMMS